MTRTPLQPPPDLLARIAADLTPVRPVATWRGVALWLPLGLLVFVGMPWYVGLRMDAATLGRATTWGASAAQMALGVWLVWAGARESRPGQRLPVRWSATLLAVSAIAVLILTGVTYAFSPTTLGDAVLPWRAGSFCFRGSAAVGAPLLFVAAVLLGRVLPGQPWLAGALFGAGAGLTADASWRLVCPVSDPWHVLVAHGGAVVTLSLIGAGGAFVVARWQVSSLRRSR